MSSCCAGSAGCRWQWGTGGPGDPDCGGKRRRWRGMACASPWDCAAAANGGGGARASTRGATQEQDGAYISSQTGCEKYCHNVLETAVKKMAISTRVLGARWGTIPSYWSSFSVKKIGVSVPRLRGSRRSPRGAPSTKGATHSGFDVL